MAGASASSCCRRRDTRSAQARCWPRSTAGWSAFTGDLLSAGGHLYQLHAMEYAYGDMDGVLFTLQSLQALRRRKPDLILPSHGAAIEAVGDDIDRLEERLIEIARLGGSLAGLEVLWEPRSYPSRSSFGCRSTCCGVAPGLARTSTYSSAAQARRCSSITAFLPSRTCTSELIRRPFETIALRRAPSRGVARALRRDGHRPGRVPTHIHDDHTCGIPYLQRHHGTACWALDEVAAILEAPAAWASTPCTYSKPIRIDRKLADGESFTWRGFDLTFHHAPGQTEFHSIISTQIDGRTVAFTGDNYFLQRTRDRRQVRTAPVPDNRLTK